MITIKEVKTKKDLRKFIQFPNHYTRIVLIFRHVFIWMK